MPWGPEVVTVMVRQISRQYSQWMLLQEVAQHGFNGLFDFLYLPYDLKKGINVGYGFINFTEPRHAVKFRDTYDGVFLDRHMRLKGKPLRVHPASVQGYQANFQHFAHTKTGQKQDPAFSPLFMPSGNAIATMEALRLRLANHVDGTADSARVGASNSGRNVRVQTQNQEFRPASQAERQKNHLPPSQPAAEDPRRNSKGTGVPHTKQRHSAGQHLDPVAENCRASRSAILQDVNPAQPVMRNAPYPAAGPRSRTPSPNSPLQHRVWQHPATWSSVPPPAPPSGHLSHLAPGGPHMSTPMPPPAPPRAPRVQGGGSQQQQPYYGMEFVIDSEQPHQPSQRQHLEQVPGAPAPMSAQSAAMWQPFTCGRCGTVSYPGSGHLFCLHCGVRLILPTQERTATGSGPSKNDFTEIPTVGYLFDPPVQSEWRLDLEERSSKQQHRQRNNPRVPAPGGSAEGKGGNTRWRNNQTCGGRRPT
jgi:hypothetical protein